MVVKFNYFSGVVEKRARNRHSQKMGDYIFKSAAEFVTIQSRGNGFVDLVPLLSSSELSVVCLTL